MRQARLTILGCGSAKPTKTNLPSSQLLDMCDKTFMIDCGEGAQLTMQQLGVRTARLYNIFISHLHGDHCLGLIGLLSTLSMLHRTQPMHIYAHPDLERLMRPWLEYYCGECTYEIIFHPINPRKRETIYEDRTVRVETIPLKHSVPTCGFLFYETHRVQREDGSFDHETRKRYAYCADTQYNPKMTEQIQGVDLLYHESTFLSETTERCSEYKHSTAREAALTARDAEVGQLLLGHFSARVEDHNLFLEEALPVFERTILAEEKKSFDF